MYDCDCQQNVKNTCYISYVINIYVLCALCVIDSLTVYWNNHATFDVDPFKKLLIFLLHTEVLNQVFTCSQWKVLGFRFVNIVGIV